MEELEQGLQDPIYESTTRVTEEVTPEPSLLDRTAVAWEEFTVAGAVEREVTGKSFSNQDPDFWKKDTDVKKAQYLNGLSHEGQLYVSEARSPEEALWRRDRALHWDSNQKMIQDAGFVDMLIPTVGAALADPTTYLFGFGEAKALGSMARASIATRFGIGATAGVAYELPQYTTNIHSDASDLVLGAVVGGVAQSAFPIGNTGEVVTKDEVVRQVADREEAIKSFEQKTSAGAAQVNGSVISKSGFYNEPDEDILENLANRNAELDFNTTTKDSKIKRAASKFFNKIDVSAISGFKRSAEEGNVVSEFIAKDILSDASGEYTRTLTAADMQHTYRNLFGEAFTLHYEKPAEAWIARNRSTILGEDLAQMGRYGQAFEDFDNAVYDLMQHRYVKSHRTDYTEEGFDPEVIEAANILDKNMEMILQYRQEAGEVGFQQITHRKGYLPRIMDNTKVQNAIQNADEYSKLFGEEFERLATSRDRAEIARLKAEMGELQSKVLRDPDVDLSAKILKVQDKIDVIRNSMKVMDSAKFQAVGQSFFQNMVRSGRGFQTNVDDMFRTLDEGELSTLIGNKDVASKIYEEFQATARETSRSARAKARIEFDLNKTSADGRFKLSDLYTTNIRSLGSRYSREAAGAVALAKKGIKSQHEWRELARLGAMQEKVGTDEYMKKMDDIYNMFLERPVDNATAQWARRLNEFTNLTMLGKTGIPQMADMAMVIANNGFVETLKATKELATMRKAIKDGTASPDMLSELESLGGAIGNDHILFSPILDRIGEQKEAGQVKKFWSKYDEITGQLSRNLFYLNGMNHVKRFQQRIATIASANRVIKDIQKGVNNDRLRAIGFDDTLIKTINSELNRGTIQIGSRGGVTALNLNKWRNINKAQEFAVALRKAVSTQVQDPLLGEGMLAMNRTVGALALKLLSFPILAMQKQLAKSTYHHDVTSLALAGYGTLFGMAIYTLNREAGLLGSEDQGDVLEDLKDDPTKFIIQSQMYNPIAGLLPDFANIAGALGLMPQEYTINGIVQGKEGLSNGVDAESLGRATPTGGTVVNILRGATLPARALVQGETPERAVYDIQAALPFGNTVFLTPIFNQMKEQ